MSSNNFAKSLSVESKKETNIDEATKKLSLKDSQALNNNNNNNNNNNIGINNNINENTKIPNIALNQIKTALGSFNTDEMSPTQINMFTVNYPLTSQQRQQITDKNYRFSKRRNSNIIDKQLVTNRRRSSQFKDLSSSLASSTGTNVISKSDSHQQQQQKTNDSIYDVLSYEGCMCIYFKIDFNVVPFR